MDAMMSGTPTTNRRRPVVNPTTAGNCSTTPRRESEKCTSSLEASTRSASLLTPEPPQKRRAMRGDGEGSSSSSGDESAGSSQSDPENNDAIDDPSPGNVNTPGTTTAHLLLKLRRDCLEQQQHQEEEQHQQHQDEQHPKRPRAVGSAASFGDQNTGGPRQGSEDTEVSVGDATRAFTNLDQLMNQTSGAEERSGTGRGSGVAAARFSGAGGGRKERGRVQKAVVPTAPDMVGLTLANATKVRGAGKKRALSVEGVEAGARRAGAAPESAHAGPHISTSNYVLRGTTLGRGENEGCTCKKSMCLKLYCQCFARQSICTHACRCRNCCNSVQHEKERRVAVKELLSRSPTAFDAKFTTEATGGGETTSNAVVHNTGCGCSKSACLKRYCECFSVGVACSDKCRCKYCKNTVPAARARTEPGIAGAGGGDCCGIRPIEAVFAAQRRPYAAVAKMVNAISQNERGDMPGISGNKRPKSMAMEERAQDRAVAGVDVCPSFPPTAKADFRSPLGVLTGVGSASNRGTTGT